MSVSQKQVLKLYRDMMREAKKITAYNFRTYGLRKIKDGFTKNKELTDRKEIQAQYDSALKSYEMLKRQVIVTNLFKTDNLVVENKWKSASNDNK
ncbi:LYR motif-containing protein 4 [Halyomorpha halys]|uniref:LYR motif-containing protein 4 n=1 Tax=Halyomorpha halys TaxID=286706 RepID=UPI0006D526D9|nr:LYR motif-containing protein 4 [Halyomorpha halys]